MHHAQPNAAGSNPHAGAHQQQWQASIRPLQPAQLYHFQWHLLRLEDAGRRSRFGCPTSDAFLRSYGERVDGANALVLACFVDGHMRGAVELRSLRDTWCGEAELAFSIEQPWRGQGIGKALMAAVVEAARARGIARLHLSCHALNRPMQAIAEGAGAKIGFESCECLAEIEVAGEPAETDLAA
jgi:GNAT superfamily N-acetyltransferase